MIFNNGVEDIGGKVVIRGVALVRFDFQFPIQFKAYKAIRIGSYPINVIGIFVQKVDILKRQSIVLFCIHPIPPDHALFFMDKVQAAVGYSP